MLGALTLNSSVGGLNPIAVEIAAREGARILWMPTLDAANHRDKHADLPPGATPPMWMALQRELDAQGMTVPVVDVLDGDGRPLPAAREVLQLAARHQLVVATGHLSAYESRVVAEAAFEAGVRHVIATHPEFPQQDMSLDDQKALAGQGAFLERCFTTPFTGKYEWARMADNIRATGAEHTIITTDLGQPHNPPVEDGLPLMADALRAAAFTDEEITTMIVSNSRLLAGADRPPGQPGQPRPGQHGGRCVTTQDGFGRLLVVSAHAADFVWRAAGYIAVVTAAFGEAHVVCLSYGEHGESPGAWKQPGMTVDQVKKIRRAEAEAAGQVLGATMHFLDQGDYPLPDTQDLVLQLAGLMRELQPGVILTHSRVDPYNYDHPQAADLTLRARMVAQAQGRPSAHPVIGAPPVFRFEPHQPEMCEFRPDVLVDITPVFDLKQQAMAAMGSQEHLVRYYADLAERRGVQARRNGGPATIRYAEAYQRVFPQVSGVLA